MKLKRPLEVVRMRLALDIPILRPLTVTESCFFRRLQTVALKVVASSESYL